MGSYAENEQDAREYASLKAQFKAEREDEDRRLRTVNNSQSTLKVKGYSVSETFSHWRDGIRQVKAHHCYDIQYKIDYNTEKFIRFNYIEQYLQFIDLLHEAGYRHDEEYEEYIIPPPPGGTVRP